jgi:hypothetical protein
MGSNCSQGFQVRATTGPTEPKAPALLPLPVRCDRLSPRLW